MHGQSLHGCNSTWPRSKCVRSRGICPSKVVLEFVAAWSAQVGRLTSLTMKGVQRVQVLNNQVPWVLGNSIYSTGFG